MEIKNKTELCLLLDTGLLGLTTNRFRFDQNDLDKCHIFNICKKAKCYSALCQTYAQSNNEKVIKVKKLYLGSFNAVLPLEVIRLYKTLREIPYLLLLNIVKILNLVIIYSNVLLTGVEYFFSS